MASVIGPGIRLGRACALRPEQFHLSPKPALALPRTSSTATSGADSAHSFGRVVLHFGQRVGL